MPNRRLDITRGEVCDCGQCTASHYAATDSAVHWQNNGREPWNFPPTFADLEAQLTEYRAATTSLAAAYEATIVRQAEEIARLKTLLKDLCGVEVVR